MATYYIAANGNDSNAGTSPAPFRSMVRAWRACTNGDSILIKTPGVWDGATALFHTQALTAGVTPLYSSTANHAPTDVFIGIDPVTPTGIAEFKIPALTGWGKNEQAGNPVAPLVAGHLWEWINPSRLHVNGEKRILLYDYGTYPAEGIKEGFSSALYLIRKSGMAGLQSQHNSLIEGVLVGQYAGMGFHQNLVQGSHFKDCESATMGAADEFGSFGTVSGFRFNNVDGSRANTALASPGAARGATTVTLATTTGIEVGDPVVIDVGRNTETRIVTGKAGNVLTLGGWKYPVGTIGDIFLAAEPLLYNHSSGAVVATQFGTENCVSRNNGRMGKNTSGGNDDFGSEGVVLQKGSTKVLSYHDLVHGNWSRAGSLDYKTEGGAYTLYALPSNSRVVISKGRQYDNHSPFEMGTDAGWETSNPPRGNGGWVVEQCVIHGLTDYHHKGVPPATAGAAISLLRANPGGVFRKVTVASDNGSPNGGFRWLYVGSYAGPLDNTSVEEIIFSTAYGTMIYRFDASVATLYGSTFPPGTALDRNLFHRSAGSGNAAVADFGANRTHAFSEAGRLSWVAKAASHGFSFSENDKWAVVPGFVDRAAADFRLLAGSPARGMAEHGDDIGAIQFDVVVPGPPAERLPRSGVYILD